MRARRTAWWSSSVVVSAVLSVAGCGGGNDAAPTGGTAPYSTTTSTTATSSTSEPASEPFKSPLYGYTVRSPDWVGIVATKPWNGKGSPGSGDPTVDLLYGPSSHRAYAFGGPATKSLEAFTAKARETNTKTRGCPKPEKIKQTTISGERAILDEGHCNGVFALSASTIHAQRVYVIFAFEPPGKEPAMRRWFGSLLKTISFNA